MVIYVVVEENIMYEGFDSVVKVVSANPGISV